MTWVGGNGSALRAGLPGRSRYLTADGHTYRAGAPAQGEESVGRYAACNVEDTAKAELSADVLFDFGSAALTPQSRQAVEAFNQGLGQRRADAVAGALTEAVPGLQMETSSAGESRPVAPARLTDGSLGRRWWQPAAQWPAATCFTRQ